MPSNQDHEIRGDHVIAPDTPARQSSGPDDDWPKPSGFDNDGDGVPSTDVEGDAPATDASDT